MVPPNAAWGGDGAKRYAMPHLKGEVPAARAVGFTDEESGNLNLWFPDSCSVRRQQPGAGSACRQPVSAGCGAHASSLPTTKNPGT